MELRFQVTTPSVFCTVLKTHKAILDPAKCLLSQEESTANSRHRWKEVPGLHTKQGPSSLLPIMDKIQSFHNCLQSVYWLQWYRMYHPILPWLSGVLNNMKKIFLSHITSRGCIHSKSAKYQTSLFYAWNKLSGLHWLLKKKKSTEQSLLYVKLQILMFSLEVFKALCNKKQQLTANQYSRHCPD